jgi:hypothetical protein
MILRFVQLFMVKILSSTTQKKKYPFLGKEILPIYFSQTVILNKRQFPVYFSFRKQANTICSRNLLTSLTSFPELKSVKAGRFCMKKV